MGDETRYVTLAEMVHAMKKSPDKMKTEVQLAINEAMLKLGSHLRKAAGRCRDGFYDSDDEKARTATRRETLENMAEAIDTAFDVDSLTGQHCI